MAKRGKTDPRSIKDVDRQIGVRIRARRLELGVSQELLARAVGVTFQQIQKYEKGVNRVAASTLVEIARALNSPIAVLLPAESDDGSLANVLDEPDLSVHVAQLNQQGRRLLFALVRALAEDDLLRRWPRALTGE